MNIKKTAKKIVAVGSGVALAGATFMGALAAAPDLAQYPSQFIDDGQFDGKIVVGANAASEDIIGAIDIAASLQAASTEDVAVGDSTTSVDLEGDAKKIGTSSDMLELGENIADVTSTLTDDDLELLSSGRITTQKGSTDYTQLLRVGDSTVSDHGEARLWRDNDKNVGNFLRFAENEQLFQYELEFTSGLRSDIDGSALEDLEDETLTFLGQEYSIVEATIDSNGDYTIDLIAGDVSDSLEQGQTRTYSIDGEDFEVTILIVGGSDSDPTVRFLVNGETTKSLSEGDTEMIGDVEDGMEIGVRDILKSSRAFEGDQGSIVEFYLGANKITFDGSNNNVEINNDRINDASVSIEGTNTTSEARINNIVYTLDVDAEYRSNIFVGEGEGVSQHLDEPIGMLNSMWDIHFAGVTEPSSEEIRFDARGDTEYEFTFTNSRGSEYAVPYVYADDDGAAGYGLDDEEQFFFWEKLGNDNGSAAFDLNIGLDDIFVVTVDDESNDGDSFVLQWDDIDTDDNTLTFSHLSSGDSFDVTYSGTTTNGSAYNSTTNNGEIRLGGKDFKFWVGDDNQSLAVDLDNDGDIADGSTADDHDYVNVVTRNGAIITLSNHSTPWSIGNGDSWAVSVKTDADDMDSDSAVTANVSFALDANDEVDISGLSGDIFGPEDDRTDDDREYAQTAYGAWFDRQGDDSGADDLVISYPSQQVEPLVYVVGGETSTTTSTSGTTAQKLNVLPVGIAVLDSEVSDDQDNLIVVGGPCANTVAADLLGNPSDCTEGFQAGMGMVRTFDTGDNVAVLVAGFSARDTVESSRVLARAATEDVSDFSGDSVEVVIAGENDVSVRAATEASVDDSSEEDESQDNSTE